MRRALTVSLGLVCALACGTNVTPANGLMIVVTSDGALGADFDAIKLQINGKPIDTTSLTLPTSFGVSGAPGTRVLFEARGLRDNVLHVAVLKETTIPNGRIARLDVKLARDCYDRCVQLGPTDTLGDVCDADTLGAAPSTKTCGRPRPIAVDTLPTYDSGKDPVVVATNAQPAGCAAPTAYCTSALTCASVVGTDKTTGALVCDPACARVDPTTSCRDASLDATSPWPTMGGQMSRRQQSALDGPLTAPSNLQPAPSGYGGVPALSKDGKRAFFPSAAFTNGSHVGVVDTATYATTALPDPPPADLLAALGPANLTNSVTASRLGAIGLYANGASTLTCCANGGALTLSSSGVLYGVSPFGVLFGYRDLALPPMILWVQRDYMPTLLAHDIAVCTSNCGSGGVALSGDGSTAYVGTSVGLVAVDLSHDPWVNKWGPLPACASDRSTPAVGADGRVYVGRINGGICVATPDGRSQTFEADDGVLGIVQGSVAVDVDGAAYFGTSTGNFYGRGHSKSWGVFLGGPITSGAAIGADGTIYVESESPNLALHALDRSGRLKWSKPLRGDLGATSSPTLDRSGTVFAGDPGGFLHALRSNGTELWELGIGGAVGTPVIVSDGLFALRGGRLVHLGAAQ